MKILYLGSVIFSRLILDELLSKKIEITNIVSLKYSKKLFKSDYYDLSKTSKKYNIKNLKVTNINSKSSIRWVKKYQPDLILCIGWSQLISKEILNIPIMGTIGFHPSKLPKNRGRHPIIWSLALGLKETASTYYLMDEKIDNGNILSQKTIKITRNDNATKLYYKIAKVAKKQILELVLNIYKNKKIKIINNKKSIGNYWRSRSFIDGQINWNSTPEIINNLVRSLTFPYPNAHFIYKDKIIKVLKSKIGRNNNKNIESGKIISIKNNNYEIKCGVYSIYLLKIYPKIKMKVGEYI